MREAEARAVPDAGALVSMVTSWWMDKRRMYETVPGFLEADKDVFTRIGTKNKQRWLRIALCYHFTHVK